MTERKIIITENLKDVLKKINHNSISNILLRGYIDTCDLANPDKELNYLDLSKTTKGYISYLTKERIEDIQSKNGDFWEVKKRYHSKPGGFITKLLKVDNYTLNDFIDQFISITNPPNYTMKVVNGSDITNYYHYSSYAEDRGTLGMSCMKSSPRGYFKLYEKNPDQINMLIMSDENQKIIGRALLWIGSDFKLMDRIYVTEERYCNYFYDWANQNDYYYKEFNNWNSPLHWVYKGEKILKIFEISLSECNFEKYPYLDTFKWLDLPNNKIYNYIPKHLDEFIVLNDHMGFYFQQDYLEFCDIDKFVYLSENVHFLDYLNRNVYRESLNYSNLYKKYIMKIHSKYDRDLDDYIFNDEYDSLNDYNLIELTKKQLKKNLGEISTKNKFSKLGFNTATDIVTVDYQAAQNIFHELGGIPQRYVDYYIPTAAHDDSSLNLISSDDDDVDNLF